MDAEQLAPDSRPSGVPGCARDDLAGLHIVQQGQLEFVGLCGDPIHLGGQHGRRPTHDFRIRKQRTDIMPHHLMTIPQRVHDVG